MDEIRRINITLAGKKYPILISKDDEAEEVVLRRAEKLIIEEISAIEQQYKQNSNDSIVMAMLNFVRAYIKIESKEEVGKILNEIRKINFAIEDTLNQE